MPWLAPDDVLSRALRLVSEETSSTPEEVVLVRDARGRLRLALAKNAATNGLQALAKKIEAELGAWFAGPIIESDGSPAHRKIAKELATASKNWPSDWPTEYEALDGSRKRIPSWIHGLVVLTSKESWLTSPAAPPPSPRVVTFYSFKGGVGRTTTLACVAARLVTEFEKRVLVIDLDLEAPGLGSFLGANSPNGVVDHLLSHLATGEVGDVQPEAVDGFTQLWVLPAGILREGYLEKLARVDFLSAAPQGGASPAETALRELITAAVAKVQPDIVLLDSRAGLHDIGGLALHRLSHADVLVARANEQSRVGLGLVFRAIARLHPDPLDRHVHLVQTMVPAPFDNAASSQLIALWRGAMYDLAIETLYAGLDEIPALDDDVAHAPVPIAEREELSRAERLDQIASELLPHYDHLAEIVAGEGEADDEN